MFISTLKESFGIDQPTYLMGIAFEIISYDDDMDEQTLNKGWIVPFVECDVGDIDAYATKYNISPRGDDDSRRNWETEEPERDPMTGNETYYKMIIKNIDGTKISDNDYFKINNKIIDGLQD